MTKKKITLPPKELREHIRFENGKVYALPTLPKHLKWRFRLYKWQWDRRILKSHRTGIKY